MGSKLPVKMRGMGLAVVDNIPYLLGGLNVPTNHTYDDILMLDPSTLEWKEVGHMLSARSHFGISILSQKEVDEVMPFCVSCLSNDSSPPDCSQWNSQEPSLFPHESDCSFFWQCTPSLTPCLLECPPGLYFNPALLVCDWPGNVKCPEVEPTIPPVTCTYDVIKNMRIPVIQDNIGGKTQTSSADECSKRCDANEKCVAWTWNGDRNDSCLIKS